MPLKKAGSNWVSGNRFFNRKVDLATLRARVLDGQHILMTAQAPDGEDQPRP